MGLSRPYAGRPITKDERLYNVNDTEVERRPVRASLAYALYNRLPDDPLSNEPPNPIHLLFASRSNTCASARPYAVSRPSPANRAVFPPVITRPAVATPTN